jgi:hypothetical protein
MNQEIVKKGRSEYSVIASEFRTGSVSTFRQSLRFVGAHFGPERRNPLTQSMRARNVSRRKFCWQLSARAHHDRKANHQEERTKRHYRGYNLPQKRHRLPNPQKKSSLRKFVKSANELRRFFEQHGMIIALGSEVSAFDQNRRDRGHSHAHF